MDRKTFAQRLKSKYPQYADVEDDLLIEKTLKKYPQYVDQLDPIEAPPSVAPSGPLAPPPSDLEPGFWGAEAPGLDAIGAAVGLKVTGERLPSVQEEASRSVIRPAAPAPEPGKSFFEMQPSPYKGLAEDHQAKLAAEEEAAQAAELAKIEEGARQHAKFVGEQARRQGITDPDQLRQTVEAGVEDYLGNVHQQIASAEHILHAPRSVRIGTAINRLTNPRNAAKMAGIVAATYLTAGAAAPYLGATAAAGLGAAVGVAGTDLAEALLDPNIKVDPAEIAKNAALEGITVGIASKIPLRGGWAGQLFKRYAPGKVGTLTRGSVREAIQEGLLEEPLNAVLQGKLPESDNILVALAAGGLYGPAFELALNRAGVDPERIKQLKDLQEAAVKREKVDVKEVTVDEVIAPPGLNRGPFDTRTVYTQEQVDADAKNGPMGVLEGLVEAIRKAEDAGVAGESTVWWPNEGPISVAEAKARLKRAPLEGAAQLGAGPAPDWLNVNQDRLEEAGVDPGIAREGWRTIRELRATGSRPKGPSGLADIDFVATEPDRPGAMDEAGRLSTDPQQVASARMQEMGLDPASADKLAEEMADWLDKGWEVTQTGQEPNRPPIITPPPDAGEPPAVGRRDPRAETLARERGLPAGDEAQRAENRARAAAAAAEGAETFEPDTTPPPAGGAPGEPSIATDADGQRVFNFAAEGAESAYPAGPTQDLPEGLPSAEFSQGPVGPPPSSETPEDAGLRKRVRMGWRLKRRITPGGNAVWDVVGAGDKVLAKGFKNERAADLWIDNELDEGQLPPMAEPAEDQEGADAASEQMLSDEQLAAEIEGAEGIDWGTPLEAPPAEGFEGSQGPPVPEGGTTVPETGIEEGEVPDATPEGDEEVLEGETANPQAPVEGSQLYPLSGLKVKKPSLKSLMQSYGAGVRDLYAVVSERLGTWWGNGHVMFKLPIPEKLPKGASTRDLEERSMDNMLTMAVNGATADAEPYAYQQPDPDERGRRPGGAVVWFRLPPGEPGQSAKLVPIDAKYYQAALRYLGAKRGDAALRWKSSPDGTGALVAWVEGNTDTKNPDLVLMPRQDSVVADLQNEADGYGDASGVALEVGGRYNVTYGNSPTTATVLARPGPDGVAVKLEDGREVFVDPDTLRPRTEGGMDEAPPAFPPAEPTDANLGAEPKPVEDVGGPVEPPPDTAPAPSGLLERLKATFKFLVTPTEKSRPLTITDGMWKGLERSAEAEGALELLLADHQLMQQMSHGGAKGVGLSKTGKPQVKSYSKWEAGRANILRALDSLPTDAVETAREVVNRAWTRQTNLGRVGEKSRWGKYGEGQKSGKIIEFTPDGMHAVFEGRAGDRHTVPVWEVSPGRPLYQELTEAKALEISNQLSGIGLKLEDILRNPDGKGYEDVDGEVQIDGVEAASRLGILSGTLRSKILGFVNDAIVGLRPQLRLRLAESPDIENFEAVDAPGLGPNVLGNYPGGGVLQLNLSEIMKLAGGDPGRFAADLREVVLHEMSHALGKHSGENIDFGVDIEGNTYMMSADGRLKLVVPEAIGKPGRGRARAAMGAASEHAFLTGLDALSGSPEIRGVLDGLEVDLTREITADQARSREAGFVSAKLLGWVGLGGGALALAAPFMMTNPGTAVLLGLLGYAGLQGVSSISQAFGYKGLPGFGRAGAAADAVARGSAAGRFAVALGNALNANLRMAWGSTAYTLPAMAYGVGQMAGLRDSLRGGVLEDAASKALAGWKGSLNIPGNLKETLVGAMLAARRSPVIWDRISRLNPVLLKGENIETFLKEGMENDSALKQLLLSTGVARDAVDRFFHFTEGITLDKQKVEDIGKIPTMLTNTFLIFNAAVDRTTRMLYMQMALAPLMKKKGVNSYQALLETYIDSKTGEFLIDPLGKEMEELTTAMDTATQGAFNYSGALRAPRIGTWRWTGKLVEAINSIPLPVSMAIAPNVALFPNFVLNNIPEIVLQHVPIANLLAPRAQDSFKAGMTRDDGFQGLRARRDAVTKLAEAKLTVRGMNKEAGKLERAARKLKKDDIAREFLLEEATNLRAEAKKRLDDAATNKDKTFAETKEPIAQWKKLRQSGYYSKQQLLVEYMGTSLWIIGVMAAARMLREDDGTKPTEIAIGHNEDGTRKVVDVSRVAGPLTVPAVIGDMIGRALLHDQNPEKYPSVTGMLEGDEAWKEAFKAFGYRQEAREGGLSGAIGGFVGGDPQSIATTIERTVSDLTRLYAGAGGWVRDVVKGGQHLAFGAPQHYVSPTTHEKAWVPVSDEQGWGAAAGQALDRVGETLWNQAKGELLQGARGDLPEAFDKLTGKKRPIDRSPLSWFLTVREQSDLNQLLENVRGEDMSEILPGSRGVRWYDEIVNRRLAEGYREEKIFELARDPDLSQPERYQRIVERMRDINMAAHTEAKRYATANGLQVPDARGLAEKDARTPMRMRDPYNRRKELYRMLGFPTPGAGERNMSEAERKAFERRQLELLEPPPDDGGLGVY